MTLHEAIKTVLEEVGKSLTPEEITAFINKKDLYQRKDGRPVSSNQIVARVSNHTDTFFNRKGKIYLLKEDDRTRIYKLFREHITRQLNYHIQSGGAKDIMDKFIDILEELVNKDLFEYATSNDMSLPASFKPEIPDSSYIYKFHIIYQTCSWFLTQFARYGVLKEKWADLLYELDWFKNSENTLFVESGLYSHFLLKLPTRTSSKFSVQNLQNKKKNNKYQVNVINERIFEAVNLYSQSLGKPKTKLKIGIFIPPIGPLNPGKLEEQLEILLTEIKSAKIGLDKALLLMPSGFQNSRSNKIKNIRKEFVKSGKLAKVIGIGPLLEHSSVHLSLLMFDFKKENSNVFFMHPDQLLTIHPDLSEIINSEILLQHVSTRNTISQIEESDYNLSPFFYTTNVEELSENEDGKLKTISELIIEGKRGTVLKNRNKLYKGGEYKYVRVPDLDTDELFFNSTDSTLGIDSDLLPNQELLKSEGIVLSAFNNKIKANILRGKEKYLIDQNLIWLKIDKEQILEEYFVLEIAKNYVKWQIESTSWGMTIPRLSFADLKDIKLRIPSLEIQKERVIQLLKKDKKEDLNNDLHELEIDFIKTLKHTIKQPTSTLSNDFSILKDYLSEKADREKAVKITDTLVKVFEGESVETIKKYRLDNTLDRIQRSINSIDYIVDQAVQIISLNIIDKREIRLKEWLEKFSADYDQIKLKVSGPNLNVFVDPKQLKILIDNFIQNAIRHGFVNNYTLNPEVFIEVVDQNRITFDLKISNNGKPLPPEFTIEDFLAKGASTKEDVGSGFGGFLIGKIVKNHGGKVILGNRENLNTLPHNIEFIVSLPK